MLHVTQISDNVCIPYMQRYVLSRWIKAERESLERNRSAVAAWKYHDIFLKLSVTVSITLVRHSRGVGRARSGRRVFLKFQLSETTWTTVSLCNFQLQRVCSFTYMNLYIFKSPIGREQSRAHFTHQSFDTPVPPCSAKIDFLTKCVIGIEIIFLSVLKEVAKWCRFKW